MCPLGGPRSDCGPTVVVGDASETLLALEKLKGDGEGEAALSELAVDEGDPEPQPKKVPSLEDPGDLGSGLSVLGVLSSGSFGCDVTD